MNRKTLKKIIVEKKESDYSSSESESESDVSRQGSESESESESYYSSESEKGGFVSIVDSGYKKSKYGSKQDHMTGDDMVAQLDNYVALKTIKEKKILRKVTPFKTWIRYLNLKTKKFRLGGLLMKVEYPDYIMLVNPKLNLTWSVQLEDNVIYIPDKEYHYYYPLSDLQKKEMKYKRKIEEQKKEKEEKEEILKQHLLSLYKKGNLALKKKDQKKDKDQKKY
jgi:hypothetical protein